MDLQVLASYSESGDRIEADGIDVLNRESRWFAPLVGSGGASRRAERRALSPTCMTGRKEDARIGQADGRGGRMDVAD